MKYIYIGLSFSFCIANIFAAPTLSLATPSVGQDIRSIAGAFLAFFATLIFDVVPQSVISRVAPVLDLDLNLAILEPFTGGKLPNYGKQFTVDGIDDSRIKWLLEAENRTPDDPVIIYFHGGGFDLGLWPFQLDLLRVLYDGVGNSRVSFLVLDYYLSTKAQYPTQLIQAVDVFNELSKTSDNIWLLGDSAGGSLSLELLRHKKYPVDGVPAAANSSVQGLVFISPWVNLHPSKTGTYITNHGKDILTQNALAGMGALYVPDVSIRDSDALEPYKDKVNWDEILPDHKKIFISIGGNEVLKGDIDTFVQNAKLNDATVFTLPGAFHDSPIFDASNDPITPHAVSFLKNAL